MKSLILITFIYASVGMSSECSDYNDKLVILDADIMGIEDLLEQKEARKSSVCQNKAKCTKLTESIFALELKMSSKRQRVNDLKSLFSDSCK